MCIVVVDDEPGIRELVQLVLEEEGHEVIAFGHPVPLKQFVQTHEPADLFLIDVMLPDTDGIALAAWLEDRDRKITPKIAMSASTQAVLDARASGLFDGAIEKPFDIDGLLATVEHCMAA